MRVIKPLRLSILQRVLTVRCESRLTISLLVYFPFEAPDLPLPEITMWQKVVRQLGKDAALDEGLPKPRGELLVHGKAFSPGGQPRPAFQARVQAGTVDKAVFVVGRRRWAYDGPTEPEPITEMPVTYENAFGGPGYAQNPVGMGASPVEEDGAKVHYLPHLEDPKALLRSPGDRPAPAGFGPLDITWPQRAQKAGTYGARWLETEFPGLASDVDPDLFQTAPLDQRIDGYFQGGEEVVIENMHPTKPRQETRVPRLRARCFVAMKGAGGESPLHEVPTRLDTVLLFPNLERGVAVFRAVQPIAEDDAADVATLLAALEGPGAPRPIEHYRAALAQRLDKEKGHLYGLREKDLLPEPDPGAPALADETVSDMDELLRREGALQKRARARAERELEQARLSMRVLGLDPDEKLPKALPPPEKPPTLDELPEYVERVQAQAKEIQAEAEVKQRSAMDEARAACAAQGIDFDALVERGRKEGGGPPAFRAEAEITRLRELAGIARAGGAPMPELEAKIEDPAFRAGLQKMEDMQLFAYRSFGHVFPPAQGRPPEEQARLRAEVERAVFEGKPLAGRDLTGADLRGLRLAGVNLRSALLERADLTGADLAGADLSGALLARAKLDGATLAGATLAGTNLGEVEGEGASFAGASLGKAIFYKACLPGAGFSGADLRGADLMEAGLRGADFSGAQAEEVLFFRADLREARFSRARLGKATFFQCSCEGIDFSQAILEGTGFLELVAERASFREARARNLRLISKSALPGADFTGADLRLSTLRGVDLTGASFEDAWAEGADFGEASLRGARLVRLRGRGARFQRTDLTDADLTSANLMEALLQHAALAGAKFEDANLFRATLMGAKGDQRTRFAGAYVTQALFTRQSG
ncbi:DUF2169 domain-containing protein [Sorangium sp. So ce131]|uniref:DUF2169 family type VI secretion system accessory protein n=1 Tax=Sorangium sp. So ce131 TaxID=3133282 RepID=UPI003F61EE22